MPLSAPAERQLLHLRDIELRGYERADGLFDIEAHLVDTKDYGYTNPGRGWIEPREALHDMWIRLTIDTDLVIRKCEAATDSSPFDICPMATPNFARLEGLKIGPGFNRAVAERVGGVHGCTHLREVLSQVATVAYQTLNPSRRQKSAEALQIEKQKGEGGRPAIIGTCLAYAPDSPVVAKRWPHLAPKKADAAD
jgi:hypothetical protein